MGALRDRLERLLFDSADHAPLAVPVVALAGLAAALPFAIAQYLPLVDFPLHQLELAVWLGRSDAGHGFAPYYEHASPFLPYWLPIWLGALFAPLFGVAAGARLVVSLYLFALPLVSLYLCRVSGRSPWFALLLVPFLFELNLRYGFVSYCLAGLLWLLCIALAMRAEQLDQARWPLALLALAALALGFTHAQTTVISAASVLGVSLLGPARGLRKLAVSAAGSTGSIPLALWLARPEQVKTAFGGPPFFALPTDVLQRLPALTFDAFPDHIDTMLFVLAVCVLGLAWLVVRERPSLAEARPLLLGGGALLGAFVLPWEWNGQAVCQRMPYLCLIALPACMPPRCAPSRRLVALLVALGGVGCLHTAIAVAAFDADTRETLGDLIPRVPAEARVAYFAVDDMQSPWVKGPAYAHAGAWITLARGGVYAEHFERLTSRYSELVPKDQRLTRKDFAPVTRPVPRASVSFWKVLLVRSPRAPGPLPVSGPGDDWQQVVRPPWTLFIDRQR
jgi:hypothetical protein